MRVKEREWGGHKVNREGCYYAAQMSRGCIAASFRRRNRAAASSSTQVVPTFRVHFHSL